MSAPGKQPSCRFSIARQPAFRTGPLAFRLWFRLLPFCLFADAIAGFLHALADRFARLCFWGWRGLLLPLASRGQDSPGLLPFRSGDVPLLLAGKGRARRLTRPRRCAVTLAFR